MQHILHGTELSFSKRRTSSELQRLYVLVFVNGLQHCLKYLLCLVIHNNFSYIKNTPLRTNYFSIQKIQDYKFTKNIVQIKQFHTKHVTEFFHSFPTNNLNFKLKYYIIIISFFCKICQHITS